MYTMTDSIVMSKHKNKHTDKNSILLPSIPFLQKKRKKQFTGFILFPNEWSWFHVCISLKFSD